MEYLVFDVGGGTAIKYALMNDGNAGKGKCTYTT